eukprot:6198252-Pleurochrysis_carterae.AAC.3
MEATLMGRRGWRPSSTLVSFGASDILNDIVVTNVSSDCVRHLHMQLTDWLQLMLGRPWNI